MTTKKAAQKRDESESPSGTARDEMTQAFGFVPGFMSALPESATASAWEELKGVYLNPATALSPRQKDLIGIAIDSQIPSELCAYLDRRLGAVSGVTPEMAQEAVCVAAITRHWSCFLNGMQLDDIRFREEVAEIMAHLREHADHPKLSVVVRSPEDAYTDMQVTLGCVPRFLELFPRSGIVGAWMQLKTVLLARATHLNSLSPKERQLVGLAVACQIPCRYSVHFHLEAANLNGASEQEIVETLALAGITRYWSTLIHGTIQGPMPGIGRAEGMSAEEFRDQVDRIAEALERKLAA